ncbi:MAG: DUF362 domain-containing protein [Fibrobacterota bacterium]
MRIKSLKKYLLILTPVLIVFDIVISNTEGYTGQPAVDSYIHESGNDEVDGYTAASIMAHASVVDSRWEDLSYSKPTTEELTREEVKELVFEAIGLNEHYGTNQSELQYKIDNAGASPWVAVKPNIVFAPGDNYTRGDQTDPRVIWAVLDYLADSTSAARITLLAGGSYYDHGNESDIFTKSLFDHGMYTKRWNDYFTDLPDSFTLESMLDSLRARHPSKTIDRINLNYNEILEGGLSWDMLTESQRSGKTPEYYTVPSYNGIGALPTSNTIADNDSYNPTYAVLNSDILVNVPVMKTTGYGVQVNCVHKNYIGSVSRAVYDPTATGYPRNRNTYLGILDHDKLVNTVVNLAAYHPSDYCVIDGLASLEGDGSHPSSPVNGFTGFLERNLIVASGDPVAADAVAAATMGLNPHDLDILRWGRAKGYGYFELQKISIHGMPIGEVRQDFIAPQNYFSEGFTNIRDIHYMGRGCRRWLLNGTYSAADNQTAHMDEQNADPRPGNYVNGKPWTTYYSPTDTVNLKETFPGASAGTVVYAYTQIFSDREQSGKFYAGGTRDMKIWLNGDVIVDTSLQSYNELNSVKDITLQSGDNRVLVKMRSSGTDFLFSLAAVNDGTNTHRDSYVPYRYSLGTYYPDSRVSITDPDMKQAFFGGRTLPGTFYHLGQSEQIKIEEKSENKKLMTAFLSPNYPNPFNGITKLRFSVPLRTREVKIEVIDPSGRVIKTLLSGKPGNNGNSEITWDGTLNSGISAPSGVYFCRLTAGKKQITRKMVYMR